MKQLEIQLDGDEFLPGSEVSGSVIFLVDSPTRIRTLTLRVKGREKTSITVSTGQSSATYHEENLIMDNSQSLMGEGIIQPGTYSERFNFTVPENALPTYKGHNTKITYEIKAIADIPKGLDVKAAREFIVLSMPAKPSRAVEAASLPAQQDEIKSFRDRKVGPAITVKLPGDSYNNGDTILASVMYANPTRRKIRNIGAELCSKEFASAKRHKKTRKMASRRFFLPLENVPEGLFSNFVIKIPESYNPSFQGMYSNNNVFLRFYLDIRWARDVYVKVPIFVNRQKITVPFKFFSNH